METPLIVISNIHAGEAAERAAAMLSELGVEHQIWGDASTPIQFQDGERDDSGRFIEPTEGFKLHSTDLQPYLAHYRLLQHALEQGWERVVVLNAVALPIPNFKEHLDELQQLDSTHQFIQLASANTPDTILNDQEHFARPLIHGSKLVPAINQLTPMPSYIITRECISRLLPRLMPIRMRFAKALWVALWEDDIGGFEVWPQIVYNHYSRNVMQTRQRRIYGQFIRAVRAGRARSYHKLLNNTERRARAICDDRYGTPA